MIGVYLETTHPSCQISNFASAFSPFGGIKGGFKKIVSTAPEGAKKKRI